MQFVQENPQTSCRLNNFAIESRQNFTVLMLETGGQFYRQIQKGMSVCGVALVFMYVNIFNQLNRGKHPG